MAINMVIIAVNIIMKQNNHWQIQEHSEDITKSQTKATKATTTIRRMATTPPSNNDSIFIANENTICF